MIKTYATTRSVNFESAVDRRMRLDRPVRAVYTSSGAIAADAVKRIRNFGSENPRYTQVLKLKGTRTRMERLSQKRMSLVSKGS